MTSLLYCLCKSAVVWRGYCMNPRIQFHFGFWQVRPPTVCPSYLCGLLRSRNIKHTGKCSLFVYLSCTCPRFAWMLWVSTFQLYVCQPGGLSTCVHWYWYWRGKDHCHSDWNSTLRINHDLGVPIEISQHSCGTFWHPWVSPEVAQSQRSGLAALHCGSLQLPFKLLIWWLDKAGGYLFPSWKGLSHLQRNPLVVIKWIPYSPWIRHG